MGRHVLKTQRNTVFKKANSTIFVANAHTPKPFTANITEVVPERIIEAIAAIACGLNFKSFVKMAF